MTTVGDLRREGRARLIGSTANPNPREASLLLARVLGLSEAQLLARPELETAPLDRDRYRSLLDRRARGEPVAYLLGEREFYGRSFQVDRRVLIPRPETEHLVAAALAELDERGGNVIDVGTGSGCVAITVALEAPTARVTGTDLSLDALDLACANARRLAAGSLRFAAADLLAGLELDTTDLVISNPPYVDSATVDRMPPDVRDYEPPAALFSAEGGLGHIARLITGARGMRAGAALICEIGAGQATAVGELAAEDFELEGIDRDYAGIERVVRLRRR
jgi:release factor glutamine methyltransferase